MVLISEYLSSKGYEWRRRGDEAIMNCPFCEDKDRKFSINLKTGRYNCLHLNNCGKKGNFFDFQKSLGDKPESSYPKNGFINLKKKVYSLPKTKIQRPKNEVIEYLKSRRLTENTIEYFHIGSANAGTVSFPYFRGGELVNIKHMKIKRDENGKKEMWSENGAEPILFNRDNIPGDELTICEGEIDCMTLVQYGIAATSVPMGAKNFEWIVNEWDWLTMFKKIYLCFDNDNAGRDAVNDLIQKLGSWRCFHVTLPHKDANECLMKNVQAVDVHACFDNAVNYPPSILVMPSTFTKDIQDMFQYPDAFNGTPTPWKELDGILKGWRSEELTVWTGHSGAGKSTMLNQVVIDLGTKGERSCIASLEMPAKRYLRWAVVQKTGNSFPAPARVRDALDWFDGKIYIVNTFEEIEPDPLLDVFEYAARRYDIKHFIIDSLMRVSLNTRDENNAQKEFVSKLVSFAKKFCCHIHLVAHPRKSPTDNDKPGKVDIKGSSAITDLAHNVLSIWRPDEEYKSDARAKGKTVSDLLLYVRKNREFGDEGKVKLWFDVNTKTYRDTEENVARHTENHRADTDLYEDDTTF